MKRFISVFISITLAFTVVYLPPLPSAQAAVKMGVPLSARSAVMIDATTRKVLYSKRRNVKRHAASTTKVMTALVVLDHLKLNSVVRVGVNTDHVSPTKLYIKPSERFVVRDLVRALLIKSANDVATILAYQVAGSERKFAKLMDKKARSLGAKNTRFINPHGLPGEGQYSTSYDLTLIMKKARDYPFIMKTLATKNTMIKNTAGKKYYLKNHNKMLWRDNRPIVGKTGFTRKALYCFVGRISYNGRDMLVSILGSLKPWSDLKKMLDYYSRLTLKKGGKQVNAHYKLWKRKRLKIFEIALRNLGFRPGTADGNVTTSTVSAVRAFQKKNGLTPDGIIGPKTSKLIEIRVNEKNYKKATRKNFERALKKAGLNPGTIDGEFKYTTIKALYSFQKKKKLYPDGIIGPGTAKALKRYL